MSARGGALADGIRRVRELGLSAMELEFVHGVRITPAAAAAVAAAAREANVRLTAHGPYYINLNAVEPEKREASVRRILETGRAVAACGGDSFTFHAAFNLKSPPEAVYPVVRDALRGIVATLRKEGITARVRPETTGKPVQFGSLEEILRLSTEVDGVAPCVDFSHLHARSGGKVNTRKEFDAVLESVKTALGAEALADMHIHVSGIEYGPKGELKHLMLKESDLKYRDLLKSLRAAGAGGVVVCESPDMEADALLLQKLWKRMK
ncbi:MAG: TIM barrel protein [Planctomycetota bacterium]